MKRIIKQVSNVISLVDGVKFFFNGCTALVRPSGTEPIVRFYLERNDSDFSVNELVRWLQVVDRQRSGAAVAEQRSGAT